MDPGDTNESTQQENDKKEKGQEIERHVFLPPKVVERSVGFQKRSDEELIAEALKVKAQHLHHGTKG